MSSLHVFIQGIHVFDIHNVVEDAGMLRGRLETVNKNRLNQKIGYVKRGQPVFVLVGGRRGFLDTVPDGDEITIRLME